MSQEAPATAPAPAEPAAPMAVDDNQQPPAADAAPAPAPESKVKPEVVPAGASEHVQQAAAAAQQPAPESSLATMPVRAYLDETVVPLLLRGMLELAKKRPENPVEWLGNFLLANKDSAVKREQ
ncbi:Dpy-30 motif [Plasmodiophora brassicae]|uniref:Uncharacterized protein n=1 Tax=Plasmodiophora brassicae TaxID=37360 RepID=A0A0G4J5D1_PLABS|nr:hypothetical protein PBRA_002727 [Plasmodiophora brassicae]SPQ94879.1 unnamed protein product [Plasmodiophora brassicae]